MVLELIEMFGSFLLWGTFLYSLTVSHETPKDEYKVYKANLIFYASGTIASFYDAWYSAYQGQIAMAMFMGVLWASYLFVLLRHIKKLKK